MIAGVVLAAGCLLVVGGSALAWRHRGAWGGLRVQMLNRWRPTAPLPLGALDVDEATDARTEALDRL